MGSIENVELDVAVAQIERDVEQVVPHDLRGQIREATFIEYERKIVHGA